VITLRETHFQKSIRRRSARFCFMATTAEEAGLLGQNGTRASALPARENAGRYSTIDTLNVWGKARDIEDASFGFSELGRHASPLPPKRQGREMISKSAPRESSIYRADNFEFSKVGLPSLYHRPKNQHLLSRPDNAALRSDEYDLKDTISRATT